MIQMSLATNKSFHIFLLFVLLVVPDYKDKDKDLIQI